MPLTSNTDEFSQYGINQNFVLSGGSASAFSTSAKFPDGFANLLSSHDFSVVAKVKLSAATQTILQTGTNVGSGNQFKLSVENGLPTLAIGSKSVTAGSMIVGTWYLVSARVNAGKLTLRIDSADSTVAQQQTSSDALLQGQDPFSLGATGMDIDNLRIYRIAISDSTIAGIARYALNNKPTVAINQAPVSDQLQVDVDARPKIIVPDPNFERLRGTCDALSAVLCLPFDTNDIKTRAYPNYMANAKVTQSSTYTLEPGRTGQPELANDNDLGTYNHTRNQGLVNLLTLEKQEWVLFDLGQIRDISSVTIYNREGDNFQTRSNTMKVFVSTTPIAGGQTPNNLYNSTPWRNMKCNNQEINQVCNSPSKSVYEVTFPKGTQGRYVYFNQYRPLQFSLPEIIMWQDNYIHFREVVVNNGNIQSCILTNTCPTVSGGGAEFPVNSKYITLSSTFSKEVFEGVKDYTVMGWFRFEYPDSDSTIFADTPEDTTSNNQLRLGVGGNRVSMTLGGSSIFYSPYNTILPNKWYHIAFVKTGPARYVYVNGKQVINATSSPPPNLTSVRKMSIGGGSYSFNGTIRDFQIHNQGLTVAQIASAANVPTFELRIPFDEPAVSTSFSDMNTGAFGLECVTQCPLSGIPGRDDRAVHFDGNQSLRVTNSTFQYVSYIGGTYSDRCLAAAPKSLPSGCGSAPANTIHGLLVTTILANHSVLG